jgi:hypothetical protein
MEAAASPCNAFPTGLRAAILGWEAVERATKERALSVAASAKAAQAAHVKSEPTANRIAASHAAVPARPAAAKEPLRLRAVERISHADHRLAATAEAQASRAATVQVHFALEGVASLPAHRIRCVSRRGQRVLRPMGRVIAVRVAIAEPKGRRAARSIRARPDCDAPARGCALQRVAAQVNHAAQGIPVPRGAAWPPRGLAPPTSASTSARHARELPVPVVPTVRAPPAEDSDKAAVQLFRMLRSCTVPRPSPRASNRVTPSTCLSACAKLAASKGFPAAISSTAKAARPAMAPNAANLSRPGRGTSKPDSGPRFVSNASEKSICAQTYNTAFRGTATRGRRRVCAGRPKRKAADDTSRTFVDACDVRVHPRNVPRVRRRTIAKLWLRNPLRRARSVQAQTPHLRSQ